MKKKALSPIITTVIMIALSLALIAVIWAVVQNLVQENIGKTEACFDIFDKIEIDKKYTYHNTTSNELKFLISLKDLELDSFLIAIQGESNSKTIEILGDSTYVYVKMSGGNYNETLAIPSSNSGKSYFVNLSDSNVDITSIDTLSIIPIIDTYQCDTATSENNIRTEV